MTIVIKRIKVVCHVLISPVPLCRRSMLGSTRAGKIVNKEHVMLDYVVSCHTFQKEVWCDLFARELCKYSYTVCSSFFSIEGLYRVPCSRINVFTISFFMNTKVIKTLFFDKKMNHLPKYNWNKVDMSLHVILKSIYSL